MEQPALSVPSTTIDYSAEPPRMIVDHWPVGEMHVSTLQVVDANNPARDLLREMTVRYHLLRDATQPLVDFHTNQPYTLRWNPNQAVTVPMGLLIDLYHERMDACSLRLDVAAHVRKPSWVL